MFAVCAATIANACGDKYLVHCRAGSGELVSKAENPGVVLIFKSDEAGMHALLKKRVPDILKRAGHTVRVVSSVDEFDRFVSTSACDIVIVDFADLPSLRASVAQIPILPIISEERSREPGSDTGEFEYTVVLPIGQSEVLLIVDEIIGEGTDS